MSAGLGFGAATGSGGPVDPRWARVEDYLSLRMVPDDAALSDAIDDSLEAGLPAIQVSPLEGQFLHLLALTVGARRILEIGTLGGYSTIWLGRALAPGGTLVSLEISPVHAEVARRNLQRAGLADRVRIMTGPALDSLRALAERDDEPFDLVFIDADKPNNPHYLTRALDLARPGALVVVDNVVRHGTVADVDSADPDVCGTQEMLNLVAFSELLDATVLQTVGSKGYDGMLVGRVRS